MHANFSRRQMILGSAAASLCLSPSLASAQDDSANLYAADHFEKLKSTLQGACDIHLHAAPDSKARSLSEHDMAVAAKKAGYRAVLFKSNDFSSHDRAYLLRQAVPGIELFGALVLNRATGDKLNVYAVKKALQTTGNLCRCIWLPTGDAQYQVKLERPAGTPFIAVADTCGNLLPEVIQIMELCAEADIIFATGHSSPEESLKMAEAAKAVGVKKFVVTHPNSRIWTMTPSQLEKAASLGAWLEYCYLGRLWGPGTGLSQMTRVTLESMRAFMKVAPERTFITTDLGQVGLPHPVEGMMMAARDLERIGMGKKWVERMIKTLPAQLLGL